MHRSLHSLHSLCSLHSPRSLHNLHGLCSLDSPRSLHNLHSPRSLDSARSLRGCRSVRSMRSPLRRLPRPHGALLDPTLALSMVQKLSTGSVLGDLALCALLPLGLHAVNGRAARLWQALTRDRQGARFLRHITFVRREGYYQYEPSEAHNRLLQEAILIYVGSQEGLVEKFAVRANVAP